MAKPLGRGPAPRLGESERAVLRQLVAADNHASLAEYGRGSIRNFVRGLGG